MHIESSEQTKHSQSTTKKFFCSCTLSKAKRKRKEKKAKRKNGTSFNCAKELKTAKRSEISNWAVYLKSNFASFSFSFDLWAKCVEKSAKSEHNLIHMDLCIPCAYVCRCVLVSTSIYVWVSGHMTKLMIFMLPLPLLLLVYFCTMRMPNIA